MSIRAQFFNYSRVLETAGSLEMVGVKRPGTDGMWLNVVVPKEKMSERA